MNRQLTLGERKFLYATACGWDYKKEIKNSVQDFGREFVADLAFYALTALDKDGKLNDVSLIDLNDELIASCNTEEVLRFFALCDAKASEYIRAFCEEKAKAACMVELDWGYISGVEVY